MRKVLAWVDSRTGCNALAREALYENIPGGSRWRYVWGSTLTVAILIQFITGIFLWMAYSPSSQTAWESVYYIQYEMSGGWLLRGIHHYTAQFMTILLVLHLMQVVIDGAYKAPREVNFWFGLGLLLIVLGLSLTGYLLPWDQKGFWATKVSTNLMGMAPGLGPVLQRILVGGADYGHFTLTRFFALHAGVLPGLLIGLLAVHIYLFRRHGITPKRPLRKPDQKFWPDQILKDAVACLAVLGAVLFCILFPRIMNSEAHLGAELGAPADPSEAFSAARPEWYFMFLFQMLKYFPGKMEVIGAVVIPTLLLGFLLVMPFIGKWRLGHRFNVLFLCCILTGAGFLTYQAFAQDRNDPAFQAAVAEAEQSAARARVLAAGGIPPEGALAMLRADPLTQGPKIFARHCASCHRYGGHNGMGVATLDPASAPDLQGFASRAWISGLLDPEHIASSNYFGGTRFAEGKMVRFVNRTVAKFTPEEQEQLKKVVAAVSAEAELPTQQMVDAAEAALIAEGRELAASEGMRCTECHQFRKPDDTATAPDLTGYGSREWMMAFVSNPAHERFYGRRNDRMPAFGEENKLDERSIGLVVDWLRGDYPAATPAGAAEIPARRMGVNPD